MGFDATKYGTAKSISDPLVLQQARRYSLRTQLAFLPDHVVGRSWFFRLLTLLYYYVYVYFHDFESKMKKKFLLKFDFFSVDDSCWSRKT